MYTLGMEMEYTVIIVQERGRIREHFCWEMDWVHPLCAWQDILKCDGPDDIIIIYWKE